MSSVLLLPDVTWATLPRPVEAADPIFDIRASEVDIQSFRGEPDIGSSIGSIYRSTQAPAELPGGDPVDVSALASIEIKQPTDQPPSEFPNAAHEYGLPLIEWSFAVAGQAPKEAPTLASEVVADDRSDSFEANVVLPTSDADRSDAMSNSSSHGNIPGTAPAAPIIIAADNQWAQAADRVFEEKANSHREAFMQSLNIESWRSTYGLQGPFETPDEHATEASRLKSRVRHRIRTEILPLLSRASDAPKGAGHYRVPLQQIRRVQQNILYNGFTEAADGMCIAFDTRPTRTVQVGVGLVTYLGDRRKLGHRVYRRDVEMGEGGLVSESAASVEPSERPERIRTAINDLLRRSIMTYGERAVLTYRSSSPWKMGRGNPLPYELLNRSVDPRIVEMSVPVLRTLTLQQKKFVFIPNTVEDELLSAIGDALFPGEYAIVKDFSQYLSAVFAVGADSGQGLRNAQSQLAPFARDAGYSLIMGVFRASAFAPAKIFYAHVDHAHEAATIALADSIPVGENGFPMLLKLAGVKLNEWFIHSAISMVERPALPQPAMLEAQ